MKCGHFVFSEKKNYVSCFHVFLKSPRNLLKWRSFSFLFSFSTHKAEKGLRIASSPWLDPFPSQNEAKVSSFAGKFELKFQVWRFPWAIDTCLLWVSTSKQPGWSIKIRSVAFQPRSKLQNWEQGHVCIRTTTVFEVCLEIVRKKCVQNSIKSKKCLDLDLELLQLQLRACRGCAMWLIRCQRVYGWKRHEFPPLAY